MNRGKVLMDDAEEWRRLYPDAWGHMVSLALKEARADRRFSTMWLVCETRKKDYVSIYGDRLKINNNLVPAFSRMLMAEYPETAALIETRHSVVDGAL